MLYQILPSQWTEVVTLEGSQHFLMGSVSVVSSSLYIHLSPGHGLNTEQLVLQVLSSGMCFSCLNLLRH